MGATLLLGFRFSFECFAFCYPCQTLSNIVPWWRLQIPHCDCAILDLNACAISLFPCIWNWFLIVCNGCSI